MAYAVYPSTLPVPEMPLRGIIGLPLQASELNQLGQYTTIRVKTRAILKGNSYSFLDNGTDFKAVMDNFYRDTLNDGLKKFTAPWLTLFGYKGYVAKLLNYRLNLKGVKPNIQMEFEFYPEVQYSTIHTSIPSPWPSKGNS